MKHGSKIRKLGRTKDQRRALINSLLNSLVLSEKIETTEAKAKELRPKIEKMITKARKDTVANRRILAESFTKNSVKKLVEDIAPRYKKRTGGYTRIIKTNPRKGDGSKMAVIEFV